MRMMRSINNPPTGEDIRLNKAIELWVLLYASGMFLPSKLLYEMSNVFISKAFRKGFNLRRNCLDIDLI